MWTFLKPLNLIRYLIVLRVNNSLVHLPRYLPTEISLVLGNIITERLPTRETRAWHKALAPWDAYGGLSVVGRKKPNMPLPEATWPIQATLLAYPGKIHYGEGELIFWELKLLGESADHHLFLELILPALEEAGFNTTGSWASHTSLWGHFDIQAIYAARGERWEPVVQDGKLDLEYQATSQQWAYGLKFFPREEQSLQEIRWVTPFDFNSSPKSSRPRQKTPPSDEIPSPQEILEALIDRMAGLLPGKHNTPDDFWAALAPNRQADLTDALEQASHISLSKSELQRAPKEWPGRWIGRQVFAPLPYAVVPYLELASILHVGRQTHLGCGTFKIASL